MLHPVSDDDWRSLVSAYGGTHPTPLERVIDVVRAGGCSSVVVENRYVDSDYRSEVTSFWSLRFDATPPFARRLHFFRAPLTEEDLHALPVGRGYLGFVVLKPLPSGPVGRTVLRPPPQLDRAVQAAVTERASLFGNKLRVRGSPFVQQDGDFLRCAHASAWMCHYPASRRGLVARRKTAAFVEATPNMLSVERPLPSKGLTLNQLQAVFGAFEQPALFYGFARMPQVWGVDDPSPPRDDDGELVLDANGRPLPPGKWDTRVFSVVCRYLNSGYPVLIATEDHAFVVVGWFRAGDAIRFIANDDQRGPYCVIDSPFADEPGTWTSIMVPLPPRVFLSGEVAESTAHLVFRAFGSVEGAPESWAAVGRDVAGKTLSLRTALRESNEYKADLRKRGLDDGVVRLLRLARLPHYLWVVEAHDRVEREARRPLVVAEAVFDSTSTDNSPRWAAMLMPSLATSYPPDGGAAESAALTAERWASNLRRYRHRST